MNNVKDVLFIFNAARHTKRDEKTFPQRWEEAISSVNSENIRKLLMSLRDSKIYNNKEDLELLEKIIIEQTKHYKIIYNRLRNRGEWIHVENYHNYQYLCEHIANILAKLPSMDLYYMFSW